MSVAKVTEITSSSPKSFEDAVQSGIARASKTLQNIKGAWVKGMKVDVENNRITNYRVAMKITFTAWIDKIVGVGVGLAVGVLLSLALTMVLARLAYVFESGDRENQQKLDEVVEQHIQGSARDKIDQILTGSALVPVLVNVADLLPGDAFGLVPADFRTAFDILESRIDNG